MAKALRTFHDTPNRRTVCAGEPFEATPERHDELAAEGLVEPRDAGAKASDPAAAELPPPQPVMVPADAVRRGPGRPPKAR